MLLASGEVGLSLLITKDGYGILAQSLGRLLLVLVVGTADNEGGIEGCGDLGGALHCKQGGLGTVGTDHDLVVIAHDDLSSRALTHTGLG